MEAFLAQFTAWAFCAVVWGMVYAETGLLLGFLLPGDSLLFAAGLLSARPGSSVSPWLLAAGVVVAAVAGDQTGYTLGARLGRPYLVGRSARIRAGVDRAEAFYHRFGWVSLVAARFIPWARTFTPFVAGVAQMARGAFLAANVVGAVIWGAGLVALGYFAYQVPWLRTVSFVVAAAFIVGSFVVGLVTFARERLRKARGESG